MSSKKQAAYMADMEKVAARDALKERMGAVHPEIAALVGDYLHFIRGMIYVVSAYRPRARGDFVKLVKQMRQDVDLAAYSDDELVAWLQQYKYWRDGNPFPMLPARLRDTARVVALRIAAGSGRCPMAVAVQGEIDRLLGAESDIALEAVLGEIRHRLIDEAAERDRQMGFYAVDPETGEIIPE